MIKCPRCNVEKPKTEFAPNASRSSGIQSMCKPCYTLYQNMSYHRRVKNDPLYLDEKNALAKRTRLRNHQLISTYLQSHPCVDCGETDLMVLEFDHQRDKVTNIANMLALGKDTILKEISKCEVRCANCHRRKTAKSLGWYRGTL